MSDKQCPTVTRPTLYGAVTLVCSGHGTCDTSSGNCTCSDGSHWASWQISPENLQPGAGGDCHANDGTATEADITWHWIYLIVLFLLEFLLCWWLYGPLMPLPGGLLPRPPADIAVSALRPSELPRLTALCTGAHSQRVVVHTLLQHIFRAFPTITRRARSLGAVITLLATIFGALFAGASDEGFLLSFCAAIFRYHSKGFSI